MFNFLGMEIILHLVINTQGNNNHGKGLKKFEKMLKKITVANNLQVL